MIHQIVGATIALTSGDSFIASESVAGRISRETGADAVDMNTFGIVCVCREMGVTHYGWRVASDTASETAPAAFREFCDTYDGDGGKILAAVIGAMPQDSGNPESYRNIRDALQKASPSK